MEREDLIKNYYRLNNSYSRKITFHLGADAGFFSEFNNMVLAILYCLDNRIKFSLYSKKGNFALNKGWNDFFTPFCEQTNMALHYRYNRRAYQMKNRKKLPSSILKMITGNDFFTQDIWESFRSKEFANRRFSIPELNLKDSSLLEASQTIIFMIWNYNTSSNKIIQDFLDSIKIPENYISIHIRSGDKNIEAKTYDCDQYMLKANELNLSKNAFILTDDYSVIEQLKGSYNDWNFYTLCSSSEKGYIHSEFTKMDTNQKYIRHLKLFASVDICARSQKFIGSFSSNPGMYMGMRVGEDNCTGVDYESWVLW